jgi:hypothetical protein
MDQRHAVQEFKNDAKLQHVFFLFASQSHIDGPETVRPDPLAAGKDKGVDISYEFIQFLICEQMLALRDFLIRIFFQDAIEGGFEIQ